MTALIERGFVIPAFDTHDTAYTQCARLLAASIREYHPDAEITILTNADLPSTNLQGQARDWFAYRLSPYRQTIKLEADMLVAGPCMHWFDYMQKLDVCVSTGCRDFYDRPAASRFYRRLFDDNGLPDVYNAITYWRRSQTAQEFFSLVRNIFEHWAEYKSLLKFSDDVCTTDVAYAMACQALGPERTTMPWATYPRIVHMKKHIIPIQGSDWTQELIWETDPLRVQTVAQWGAFHYHVKDWRP